MGSSQSSHAKYSSNSRSSSDVKTQFRTTSVRGRKRSQLKQSKQDSAPSCLDATSVSYHFDDVHHPDFYFSSTQISSSILDHAIIENIEIASHDTLNSTACSFVEEDDESISSSDMEGDLEEFDEESEMERLHILQDTFQLKEVAGFFLHPEAPVLSTLGARCYFDRPSAPLQLSSEEANEIGTILDDAKALKVSAIDYMHPELPVVTSDPGVFGRNFFNRYNHVEDNDFVDPATKVAIIQDASNLKKLAIDFLHPEIGVLNKDPTSFGRNYFTRFSAPDTLTSYKDSVMEDLKMLKRLAVDYLHPELPVTVSDPNIFGRNYFSRHTSVVQESLSDAVYRSQVMSDLKSFKAVAIDFLHPEIPVTSKDPCICARNYFDRFSAAEQESLHESTVRSEVIKDLRSLKQFAVDYLHPEIPISSDPTSFARNFFCRPGAPLDDDILEKELVMQDVAELKRLAADYRHPERSLIVDPNTFGRNYFARPSASIPDDDDDVNEVRELIFNDMQAMKALAIDYFHPERPVATSDMCAVGRNYFTRWSAPLANNTDAEERELILKDALALKKLAIDYLHPENPVITTDSTLFGRNYFDRCSATELDSNERDLVMADIKTLKKLAVDYLHPEISVFTADACAFGRNFFDRYSASELGNEEFDERASILDDAKALKKLAVDYLHPEVPVSTVDPLSFGRNYFDRASANAHYYMIHTFPSHDDDNDEANHHEHLDHFGMDDEMAMYEDMRHELSEIIYNEQQHTQPVKAESDEQGNLSRSPSSIMLFELAA